MPSQPVLDALEELHRSLEKMKPAIETFKLTGKLTDEVNKIPSLHIAFIHELQEIEKDFQKALSAQAKEHESILNEKVNLIVSSAVGTMDGLSVHNEQLLKLRNSIQSYYSKLDGMQLPIKIDSLHKSSNEKLDKLDGNSIRTQVAQQGILARLESIEVKTKELSDQQTEKLRALIRTSEGTILANQHAIEASLKQITKEQVTSKTYTFATWILIALSTILILILSR